MQRIQNLAFAAVRRYSSATYTYKTLEVKRPFEYVVHVAINRPDKRNCISAQFIQDYKDCFEEISNDKDCRAVVLSGNGKIFCAGIDFQSLMKMGESINTEEDISRKYKIVKQSIENFQNVFKAANSCTKPVIAAIHGGCIGAGTAIAAGADIRLCSSDAWFQIKEVELGLAPDVGNIQKFIKGTGNDSLLRELIYTARSFNAEEALKIGLVSRINKDHEGLMKDAMDLAQVIAEKSPVAVQNSKQAINYSTDNTIDDGLKYMALMNGAHLQSEDLLKSFMAIMQKEKPTFSKL